jgi:DNA adenine methylase
MINYMGGKFANSKTIAALIEEYRKPGQAYFEPFCGGAWVLGKVTGERYANDKNKALITYYKSVQKGYIPPDNISEDEYQKIKQNQDENDPLTAFAMLACSFGAKWGSCYARSKYDYAATGQRASIKYRKGIEGVTFASRCYTEFAPNDMIIYCDPPYIGTAKYKHSIDHDVFWEAMRKWSQNNTVLISEYTAPDDFQVIHEFDKKLSIRSKKGCEIRKEKIFKFIGDAK